jgi:hypothetical protein
MDFSLLRELNSIIETDRADTTYKYALLRAISEICQENRKCECSGGRYVLPFGAVIAKWLLYYYPIFDSQRFIPQKHNEKPVGKPGKKIAFREQFQQITDYYGDGNGGISEFYVNYLKGTIPTNLNSKLIVLLGQLRDAIRYPMKHLGSKSYGKYNAIFFDHKNGKRNTLQNVNPELVHTRFGDFSISKDHYNLFKLVGGFISGEASVLNKWAEFTVNANPKRCITYETITKILYEHPETERNTTDSKSFYNTLQESEPITCIWSGKKIAPNELNIDHMLPFAHTKNNHLWNLLPSSKTMNSKKSDKIPSPSLLRKRKESILYYWHMLNTQFPKRFKAELQISLTGFKTSIEDLEPVFETLIQHAKYQINEKRLPKWDG